MVRGYNMANYLDKDAIVDSLTKENVITILTDLGSAPPRDLGENGLVFQTVCHGGSRYKLYYYHEAKDPYPAKLFHCYTDCSSSFGIYELVIRAKRAKGITITFYQAVRYVASITNNLIYSDSLNTLATNSDKIDDWEWINRLKKSGKGRREIPQLPEIDEHVLEMFYYAPYEGWLKEGISRASVIKYEISYWGKENKIIIPHRDGLGRLIGVRGRTLNKDEEEAGFKYMPITVQENSLKHKLGLNLYGLYQCKEAIKRTGKIMIVESEKSVLLGDSYYGHDNFVVATCGSTLTDTQCKMIRASGAREVFIAYDKEFIDLDSRKAELYYNKLLNLASQLAPYMTVYIIFDRQNLLQEKQSPLDCGKEVLELLMKDKILVTTKMEE